MILPRIVVENAHVIALDKPSGMPSVPRSDESGPESALTWVLKRHPELAHLPERRPGQPALLHRLDTSTSGLLLFARTQHAFETLIENWRAIDKFYRAWVASAKLPRIIDLPLAHDAKSARRMIAVTEKTHKNRIRGKILPSKTEVIKTHASLENLQDIEVRIHEGRMHQIRCHLASVGAPLLGDAVYKGQVSNRLWLHAACLGFSASLRAQLPGLPDQISAPLPGGWGKPLSNP